MADFDVIVVGAGYAGTVAAYELAKAGKSVLVVERGNYAGAKNMTGGRIYSHSLKKVFPNFEQDSPVERRITHERISLMDPEANFTIDFTSKALKQEGQDSYSVLSAVYDQWLAEQAENAGAEIIYGIPVEDLIMEGASVKGVIAGEDSLTAEITILADGVNSLLTAKAVGARKPKPSEIAVGVKELIELPSGVIEDRFLCNPGEGAAWLFAGDATHGHIGGGFMYTNKDSISLGLVATISDLTGATRPIYQMMEDFKKHPAVAPLVRGGKVVEYSGHMVSEGGYAMVPKLVANGCMVTGDAAMLCMNLGYCVRGMDFAVASGQMAAQAAVEALDAGSVDEASLHRYVDLLENSFVLRELKQYRRFPHFMESTTRIFKEYPAMVKEIMNSMFVVDGKPADPLKKKIMDPVKEVGVTTVLKDAMGGMKAL